MPLASARSQSKFLSHVIVFFCLTVTTSPCQQGDFPPVIVANYLAFRHRCASDYDPSEATTPSTPPLAADGKVGGLLALDVSTWLTPM
jgi:hypothetical protein